MSFLLSTYVLLSNYHCCNPPPMPIQPQLTKSHTANACSLVPSCRSFSWRGNRYVLLSTCFQYRYNVHKKQAKVTHHHGTLPTTRRAPRPRFSENLGTTQCARGTAKRPFFCFSLQLFHFMTNKIVHHDRNGQFACNFFHCDVIILS